VESSAINATTYDLSLKNPNGGDEVAMRTPKVILNEIAALDAEGAEMLLAVRGLL
jgi:type I restriction enzyme M protein